MWLAGAGQRLLQLLPITETSPDDPSPYGSISAMAIDPQYISLADMEDFAAIGGEERSKVACDESLDRVRSSSAIDYRAVRKLKQVVLRRAFDHFVATEWTSWLGSRVGLPRVCARNTRGGSMTTRCFERCTLDIRSAPGRSGRRPSATSQAHAIEVERRALEEEMLFRTYLQWVADEQWQTARKRSNGVALFGDLPFMVSGDSADVWSRQDEFEPGGVCWRSSRCVQCIGTGLGLATLPAGMW